MAIGIESSLEALRAKVAGIAGIAFCERGGDVTRFTADPSAQTYALVVGPDMTLLGDDMNGSIDVQITPTVAVFTSGMTETEVEALFLLTIKTVLNDPDLGGTASNVRFGGRQVLDFLQQVEGFNVQFEIDLLEISIVL